VEHERSAIDRKVEKEEGDQLEKGKRGGGTHYGRFGNPE